MSPLLLLVIVVVLLALAFGALAGVPMSSAGSALLVTSSALLAVRVMLQFALAGSYAERGAAFWLSPTADPLAALRILLSTLRRPTRWRSREYGTLGA